MPEPISTMIVKRDVGSVNTLAETIPDAMPNIYVKVVSPIVVVLIRGARVFLQSLLGMFTMTSTGAVIPSGGFIHNVQVSAALALAPTAYCVIQNTIELLAKLDESMPQLRG